MSGIQMALLGSAGTPLIQLTTPVSVVYFSGGFFPAVVGYQVANDGYVYTGAGNFSPSYSQFEQWDTSSSTVGNYEVRATLNSGTTPTGTLSTWLNLGTTRTWSLSAAAGNFQTCNLTIEIRDTATSTVQATAILTLEADAT
jgi:hypothetical protein